MIYRVNFANLSGQNESIVYRLLTHSVAMTFRGLNLRAISQGGRPSNSQINASFEREDLISLLKKLNHAVSAVNNLCNQEIPLVPDAINEILQTALNTTHMAFHQLADSPAGRYSLAAIAEIQKINLLVHASENALRGLHSPYVRPYYVCYLDNQEKVKLLEEEREMFTLQREYGDLYLGYGTVGKNLYQIYLDNDRECLVERKVRPQETVSSEVVGTFYSKPIDAAGECARIAGFFDWCDKFQSRGFGFDPEDPIHRPGLIPLGKLLSGPTADQVTGFFREYSVITEISISLK